MAAAPIRAAAVALALLAVVGCSDDEDPAAGPTEPAPTAAVPTPTPTPEPTPTTPAPTEQPAQQTYTVEEGDTLSGIANRFGTTVEDLIQANDISNPDLLGIGDELVVPGGGAEAGAGTEGDE